MNEKINLQDLVALLSEKAGITKKDAEIFLKEYLNVINEGLLGDKIVKVKSLGTFKSILVNERESVDVTNGDRVLIPAHYRVSYSPDAQLAQTINEPFSLFEGVEIINDSIVGAPDEADSEQEEIKPVVEKAPAKKKASEPVLPVIEKKPKTITEKKPEVIIERKPEIIVEKKPEVITERKPEIIAEKKPEIITERKPEVIAEKKPEVVTERKTGVIAEKRPEVITERKPEIIAEKKPETEELVDEIKIFTEISNPPRGEEAIDTRPSIRTQRKKQGRRFPWEWILCALALFGIGWLYYTIESSEQQEIESIRAAFIPPENKTEDVILNEDGNEDEEDSENGEKKTGEENGEKEANEPVVNETSNETAEERPNIPLMLSGLTDAEIRRNETPKVETPKDTIKVNVPREEPKKEETPKVEPKVEPKTEAPKVANVEKTNPVSDNSSANTTNAKTRKIASGERLTLIALEEYGHKSFWIYLYLENKSRIANPNNVSAGTEIIIPPAAKYNIDKNSEASIKKANELVRQNR